MKLAPVAAIIAAAFSSQVFAANADHVARALGHLNTNGKAAHKSTHDSFKAKDTLVDEKGGSHVRFDRSHKGLKVIGGDLVVHSDNKGQLKKLSQTLNQELDINTTAGIDGLSALMNAQSAFIGRLHGHSGSSLVVYARGAKAKLAYEVRLDGEKDDGTPSEMSFIVDANSGQIVDAWDHIHTGKQGGKPGGGGTGGGTGTTVSGTGHAFFGGSVALTLDSGSGIYTLRDPSRGSMYTTDMGNSTRGNGTTFTNNSNVFGDGSLGNRATTGVDAQYGTAMTWDYFKNTHGRNGIANDGRGAFNRVHYGRNYVNAFWSDGCFCMTYGDGDGTSYYPLDSLDVAGHEMTHGVTSRTANLIYSGESGGLNEATSDIFGTLVEFYANNANDPADYMIGEELYINNASGTKAMRYMFKPSLDNRSPDCYSSTLGSLDVHYSSGIANHFFYLLAEGATVPSGFSNLTPSTLVCNGNTSLNAIGRDAAGKIWYKALTQYMTSNTNYAGARVATLNAAADLYGVNSAQYNAVAAAWSAVSVN